MSIELAELRKEYTLKTLSEDTVDPNPVGQFTKWFEEALASSVNEPNAMHLATVDQQNRPNGRIVLLKSCDERGFTFFTNYTSQKGTELIATPFAAITFFWPELERQVRIQGSIEMASAEESDAYFSTRPRGSQLGAWASVQSQVIPDREFLEKREEELEARFAGADVPRPPHWGGFRLNPEKIEFWQGRASRLHDRIRYVRSDDDWKIERLSP